MVKYWKVDSYKTLRMNLDDITSNGGEGICLKRLDGGYAELFDCVSMKLKSYYCE